MICFICRSLENDPQKSCSGLNKSREVYFYGKKIFQHFRKCGEVKIEYPKGSNGEQDQKWKVFGLLFYDTPFKNCIFSMDALIARRSKYDFWIPDKILTLEIKIQIKKIFFRDRKFWSKKNPENFSDQKFFPSKNQKIDFFEKSIFSIFGWENFFGPKIIPDFFFDQNFRSRKNIFLIWIFISRVKISPGIQKSYLERRAMSASMLKMQFLKGVS